jgi:hypothetical protein
MLGIAVLPDITDIAWHALGFEGITCDKQPPYDASYVIYTLPSPLSPTNIVQGAT